MDELIARLEKRMMLSDLQSGLQPDYDCRKAATALRASQAEIARLREALDQLLDDMGDDGLCVCPAAKDQARAALKGDA